MRLEADPRYDGFEPGLTRMQEAVALFTAGRIDDAMAVLTLMAAGTGVARAIGLGCLLSLLPGLGRAPEARMIAEDTLAAANATGSMIWLLTALYGYGRAHIDSDPVAALDALRQSISLAHQHRLPVWVAIIAQDAAPLEAVHGDLDQAIELFDSTIQACWHSGENVNLAGTLASVVKFFDHRAEPELAATVYGIASNIGTTVYVLGLDVVLDRLRTEIGAARYDQCVAAGTQMEPAEAIPYVRQQLRSTQQRPDPT